ncbi:hypothetical protein Sango_1457300 [Sesamum angolense]|uniref:Uncharacterized protein n=1 Tax=Sesamum angolense TaxID=2727404 RepID=A0AAE1WN54_9LAMI|nr:hypothetical protein Sango_1457300 [Sesamum angolense]
MGWLPEILSDIPTRRNKKAGQVGILAFETAKTMSRLISLYKSLSDEEIIRLTKDVVKSEGVAFLNSRDEEFLLSLACAEKLEDLDRAAAAISRLGKKCSDSNLDRFDLVYMELKLGIVDFGKSDYGSRMTERKVQKMEKLVSATSSLHAALDALAEMEISERKVKEWKKGRMQLSNSNFDHFNQKIENHEGGPLTLGGLGLALRYANVILLAEKYLDSAASIGRYERESLYQMLTENLKALVRTKLSKNMKCKEDDALLADGWRGAMAEIMGWLAPMAHNTVRWQMERNVEKMKFDSKPGVLLLQTLHFSDKEKTEAAVAEVQGDPQCILMMHLPGSPEIPSNK